MYAEYFTLTDEVDLKDDKSILANLVMLTELAGRDLNQAEVFAAKLCDGNGGNAVLMACEYTAPNGKDVKVLRLFQAQGDGYKTRDIKGTLPWYVLSQDQG